MIHFISFSVPGWLATSAVVCSRTMPNVRTHLNLLVLAASRVPGPV